MFTTWGVMISDTVWWWLWRSPALGAIKSKISLKATETASLLPYMIFT
jgi:hypothetical protein